MNKDKKKPDKPYLSFKNRKEVIFFTMAIALLSHGMVAFINNQAWHQRKSADECRARNGAWVVQIQSWMGYCEEPVESGSAAGMFIPFLTVLTTARRKDNDDEPKTMYGAADDALATGPADADVGPPG